MNIKTDIPQICALRKEIEKLTGGTSSHSSFIKLQCIIEERLKEHISVSTLERLWGYSTRKNSNISIRILNILTKLVGSDDWEQYCANLKKEGRTESELFMYENAIICNKLAVGTRVRIGWQPNRVCEIEHRGDNRFCVINAENASIKAGDVFSCLVIEKNRPLFIENLSRHGEKEEGTAKYIVGKTNGLTIAEVIE